MKYSVGSSDVGENSEDKHSDHSLASL